MNKSDKYNDDGFRVQVFPKGEYEPMAAGDPVCALIDMGIKSLARKPAKYPEDADGLELFKTRTMEYFQHIYDANSAADGDRLCPDIESWCCYLRISRRTLSTYYRTRDEQWRDMIDRIKDVILAAKKDLAGRFKMPPVVFMFDATNNHGYRNTNQIEVTTETEEKTAPRMSEEELQRIIDERAELDDLEG